MKINKKIIEELTDYLKEFNLSEIEYSEGSTKVKVGRSLSSSVVVASEAKKKQTIIESDGTNVTSPIVGTAYLAPEPGAKPFISVGKKIKKGETVMIIEAMKTMNHVPSPISGTVKKICIEDGQPAEYGQVLVMLD